MSSQQICIFLTHLVYSLYTKCENSCVFAKRSHNRLSRRLCTKVKKYLSPQLNTMVGLLIQASGSQYGLKPKTTVVKGQKMSCAKAIQI